MKDVNYCTIMLMRLRLGVSVVQFTESSPSFPHIRMVLSPPHEARSVPLGLQLTNQQRESGCALNLCTRDRASFMVELGKYFRVVVTDT